MADINARYTVSMVKKFLFSALALILLAGLLYVVLPYVKPSQPTRAQQLKNEDRLRPSPRLNNIFNGMSDGFNKK